MLLLETDKKFDGLKPETVRAYYKSHISKPMGIDVVVTDFEYILENGGKEIKLVLQRSQSAKVIQGKLVDRNGVIIIKKGDIH